MIKLETDFHLSTIIEKRGRCPGGGSKYTWRQIYIAISCGIIDILSNLLESLSLQHPNLQLVFSMGTFLITKRANPTTTCNSIVQVTSDMFSMGNLWAEH